MHDMFPMPITIMMVNSQPIVIPGPRKAIYGHLNIPQGNADIIFDLWRAGIPEKSTYPQEAIVLCKDMKHYLYRLTNTMHFTIYALNILVFLKI